MTRKEIIQKSRTDPRWFIENHLKILPKESLHVVPFQFNNVQLDYFWDAMQRQLAETGKIRQYWLKARRMGASTLSASHMFTKTIMYPNTLSRIIAHKLDAANVIFKMAERFYSQLPADLQPEVKRHNKRELLFQARTLGKTGLGSQINVDSADDSDLGRASNTWHVHGSEMAFWPPKKSSDLVTAVQQAVPNVDGTSIIYESTAKMMGGEFYEGYWRAKDDENNDWMSVFVPWFAFDEYRMPLDKGEKMKLDSEEKRLKSRFNLSDEQIKWRRFVLHNQCMGKVEVFRREYPSTDIEAFEFSHGRGVFNIEILSQESERTRKKEPIWVGDVERDRFKANPGGDFYVWEMPADGRPYFVGMDPAEGIDEGCLQAIEVIDGYSLEQVAEWSGRATYPQLARIGENIARQYNDAILAIEVNNHGHAVISHCTYHNLYRRREGKKGRKVGWHTSDQTKQMIIDNADHLLYYGHLTGKINSPDLIQEAKAYQLDESGRAVPPPNQYADRLMAWMIALYVAYQTHGAPEDMKSSDLELIQHEPYEIDHMDMLMKGVEALRRSERQEARQEATKKIAPLVFRS